MVYEERKDKVKELYDKLIEKSFEYRNTDEYKNFLRMLSKFHTYSFNNVLLIGVQRPDATYVAGFVKWLELKRHVKKGEKGIAILAPLIGKRTVTKLEKVQVDGEIEVEREIEEQFLRGFKVVYVFDVSQTEGEPLPIPQIGLTTEQYKELLPKLKEVSPYPVEEVELRITLHGYFVPSQQKIYINALSPADDKMNTLFHEIGHGYIHKFEYDKTLAKSRNAQEIIAESVAFIVADYFGLDTTKYSMKYVAFWDRESEGDKEYFLKLGVAIQKIAHTMIEQLSERLGVKSVE